MSHPYKISTYGPLTRYANCGLCMHHECRERFPRHRLKRKPLVSDPGMHHDTCVMNVPWCMSESLTSGGGENFPGIPGACAIRNFAYLVYGPCMKLGSSDAWVGILATPEEHSFLFKINALDCARAQFELNNKCIYIYVSVCLSVYIDVIIASSYSNFSAATMGVWWLMHLLHAELSYVGPL